MFVLISSTCWTTTSFEKVNFEKESTDWRLFALFALPESTRSKVSPHFSSLFLCLFSHFEFDLPQCLLTSSFFKKKVLPLCKISSPSPNLFLCLCSRFELVLSLIYFCLCWQTPSSSLLFFFLFFSMSLLLFYICGVHRHLKCSACLYFGFTPWLFTDFLSHPPGFIYPLCLQTRARLLCANKTWTGALYFSLRRFPLLESDLCVEMARILSLDVSVSLATGHRPTVIQNAWLRSCECSREERARG